MIAFSLIKQNVSPTAFAVNPHRYFDLDLHAVVLGKPELGAASEAQFYLQIPSPRNMGTKSSRICLYCQ